MSCLMLSNLKSHWDQAGTANIVEGTVIPLGVSIFVSDSTSLLVRMSGHRFDSQL
jgi:hypothetical protein